MSRLAHNVYFHPEVERDLQTSFLFYLERSQLAAASFQAETEHAVKAVTKSPGRRPIIAGETRQYVYPRFPFSMVYRVTHDGIEAVAIAHQKRKPGYWSMR